MCCALAALLIAMVAACRGGFRAVVGWRPPVRWLALSSALAVFLVAGSALAAKHFDHYAARARAHDRSVLAEIWAQPICNGAGSTALAASSHAEVIGTD
ncbi:MAG TPA: hypothetical protein VHA10_18325 [Hypericibacter adhaerens]|jgi:hypothetical protein|uniref:hypothetical protein n=1 Tax=Hypericibacter adhaerens TaxID=2602016 RepID=UPI002BC79854|nr:hypothetical protein [Hypericibacter adhaerens]HWA45183.1 hypothetical protein [Hypericibacter adhaerens]